MDQNKGRAEVVEELLAALERHPDQRVGQVIANALPERYRGDPFYIEDVKLAELLRNS